MTTTTRCHKPAPTTISASSATRTATGESRISSALRTAAGFALALTLITLGVLGTSHGAAEAGEPIPIGATAAVPAGSPVDGRAGVPGRLLPSGNAPAAPLPDTRRQQQGTSGHHRADDSIGAGLTRAHVVVLRAGR